MLGEQTAVATLPIIAGQTPLQIARRAADAGGFSKRFAQPQHRVARLYIKD